MQSPYLMCGGKGCHFRLNIYTHLCKNPVRVHALVRFHAAVRFCVAHCRPVCLTRHIHCSLSFALCPSPPLLPRRAAPRRSAGTYMHVCRLCTVLCCCGTRQLHCNAALCALIGRETSAMWYAGRTGRRKRQSEDTAVVISDG